MLNSIENSENTACGGEAGPAQTQMGSTAAPSGMTDQQREAIDNALERLVALGIDSAAWVYVDDENRLPSYALHVGTAWGGQRLDDEELDYAIGWLPAEAFLNDDSPWPGSYNPYITVDHLRQIGGVK
jgi:hypothetical protein